ncbi:hypothetical protein ABH911_004220 [Pseudomonas protegens]|uniref:hypothetical protein n=1 Tax=Pseudomonas protegens TaxID=380021 RepID=UPI002187982B|nr:hypothetical protein [Pseudomonas protegens]MCU1769504.1 hypothetical protein [Pseudomonas protegens]URN90711.1 MAG: hypothetical protein NAG77_07485 [Pseudomonas protegens]WEK22801.1 MAG: hypothetical protein P0Y61_21335 [Pseudomonas protegens]
MFCFSQWRVRGAVSIAALLLGGCSFNGTYPDASAPDAAKLRFISSSDSSTLDLFDAEHCGGQTTGLLNNLFSANTRRRAAMSAAAPEDAKAYLEVRLQPGHELFARANTLSTGSVCTVGFNFTPQSGGEYEADFRRVGRTCQVTLSRLRQIDGKTVRSPIVLTNKGLPACAGHNPIFPKPTEAQPQSAERAALIAQIVDASVVAKMKPDAEDSPSDQKSLLDKTIAERKQRLAFSLPDAYWTEYQQNLEQFANEMRNTKARSLQLYKDDYSNRLGLLDTPAIKELLPDSETADRSKARSINNAMLEHYYRAQQALLKETLSAHQARMADLDQRFEVCKRFAACWQR